MKSPAGTVLASLSIVGLAAVSLSWAVWPASAAAISDPTQIPGLQLWLDGSDTASMALSYYNTGLTVTSTSSNTTILTASGAIPAYIATSSLIRVGSTAVYTVASITASTLTMTGAVANYSSAQTLYVNRVNQLNDKSGNGANAVQATGANQFTYLASGDNGLPGLFHAAGDYTGSGAWFGGTFANSFSTSTIFAVGNMNPNFNNNNTNSNYFELGTSTPYLKASQSAGIAVNDTFYNSIDVPRGGAYVHAVYPVNYLKQVASFVTLGITYNNRALSVDGFVQPSYDTAPLILPAFKTYVVGATWAFNFPTQQLNGNFDEMIVYNRTLTSSEQASVEQYLMTKWGETAPLGAPTGLTTNPGNGTMQISFAAPTNNGGTPPFDYDIQYKLHTDANYIEFPHSPTGIDPTSGIITGLTDNLLYDFKIAAVNALGTSTASATVSDTPIPSAPEAPTSLLLQSTANGSLTFSWQAPANTGGSPITSYRISYAPLNGATSTVTTRSTSFTLTALANTTFYYATVRATTGYGDSPESIIATGAVFNPNDPASAGYGTSFDDEFNSSSTIDSANTGAPGYNWYLKQPFGYTDLTSSNVSVSGGELTLSGPMNQGGGLQSAYAPAGQTKPSYVGSVFSGGWYVEARIKYDASAINTANGWPAFWMFPIESYQNYASGHAFSLLTHTVEDDVLDNYTLNHPSSNCATMALSDSGTSTSNTTCFPGVSFDNVYHTYGQLWVPSANGNYGYIQNFVDGIPTGYASWVYTSATSTTPFSTIEQTHFPIILTAGTDAPTVVDYVRVWQLPQFSGISSAFPGSSQATISWNTRDFTSQKLTFGPSTSYGSTTPESDIGSTTNSTAHAVSLQELVACTTYHYAVVAGTTVGGYATSTDQTLSTPGCTGNATGGGAVNYGSSPLAPGWIKSSMPAAANASISSTSTTSIYTVPMATTASDVASTSYKFTRNLQYLEHNAEVQMLQHFLNTHGSPVQTSGPGSLNEETMLFGLLTLRALETFQASNKIGPASGYFGPITRAFVNAISE